ncbi:MAG: tetratricopeptide repeat protein, partial [Planctomycetota bacterium]
MEPQENEKQASAREDGSGKGAPAESDSEEGKEAPPPISARRKWGFRLAGMTMVPLIVFLILEGILRLFGFGYATDFFLPLEEHPAYRSNMEYTRRFFPRALVRPPLPMVVPREKAEGGFRIFVLGGSAAQGDPSPPFGFSRHLEVMLEKRYPGGEIEVINTAITAINSHVVRGIAQECARMEPDLFIVYMGNNEVVGPYGPGTVFLGFSPSLSTIRTGIWVKSTKIGQLIEGALHRVKGQNEALKEWKGMEMFVDRCVAGDDSRLEAVYGNFAANLRSILDAAGRAKAPVILCTVAVNLTDCAPFASLHRGDLTPADLSAFEALCEEADERARSLDVPAALEALAKAESLDGDYAELHYRMGRLHYGRGDWEAAREHFERARDLDALRFRADSGINRIIREVAAERKETAIRLVDVEKVFEASSPHGLPGEEFFHEHVHMNFKGNHLLARVVFRQVEDLLPSSIRDRAAGEDAPCSEDVCSERLAYTGWNRFRILKGLLAIMEQAPFSNQMDIEERNALRRRDLEALKERFTTPEALEEARKVYRKSIARHPDDLFLRQIGGKLFMEARDFVSAVKQYEYLRRHAPGAGAWPELEAEALVGQGTQLKIQRKAGKALECFHRAAEVCPGFAPAFFNIGLMSHESGKLDEAMENYREALRLYPPFTLARNNLALALASKGLMKESYDEYKTTLADSPRSSMVHGNLGDLLVRMGRSKEAEGHYLQALEDNPKEAAVRGNLADLLVVQGRFAEATEHYIVGLDKKP